MAKYSFKVLGRQVSFEGPKGLSKEQAVKIAIAKDPTLLEGTISKAPTFRERAWKFIKEQGPELVGGLIGEVAGGAAAGAPGMIAGGAIGQAAPRIARQAAERPPSPQEALIEQALPGPAGLVSQFARGLETPAERKEAGLEAVTGAIGGAVGAATLGVASKLMSPFKKTVIQDAQAARRLFSSVEGQLTPAQATDSKLIDFIEEMVENSFTGQPALRTFKEVQQKNVNILSRRIANSLAHGSADQLSDKAIGQLFLNAARGGKQAHRAIVNRMYAEIDDIVRPEFITKQVPKVLEEIDPLTNRPISRMVKVPKKILVKGTAVKTEALKKLANKWNVPTAKGKRLVSPIEIRSTIQDILALDDNLTFSEMHAIRSGILSRIRDLQATPGKGSAIKGLSDLTSKIDELMEQSARNLPDDAEALWRNTNKFFKEGKEVFDNDFMANLIIKGKTEPAKMGEAIFQKGNVREIARAKKAIERASQLDPSVSFDKTWSAMKAGYFESLLNRHTDFATGTLKGKGIISELSDRRWLRTLQEGFSNAELNLLKKFAKVTELTQEKTGATGAGVLMKIGQAGAAGTLLTAPFLPGDKRAPAVIGGVGLLLAPAVVARLLTRPAGIKLLTEGYQLGLKGKAAFGQLPSFLTRMGISLRHLKNEEEKKNKGK